MFEEPYSFDAPGPFEAGRNEAILKAIRAAEARRRGAFVRLHIPLSIEDPWEILGHPGLDHRVLAAWQDPLGGDRFVAVDALETLDPSHFEDRHALATESSQLCEHSFDAFLLDPNLSPGAPSAMPLATRAPLLVGGLAFLDSDERAPDGPFAAFGRGRLWVPRLVLHARSGATPHATAVLSLRVYPRDTLSTVLFRTTREIRTLEQLLDGSRAPHRASRGPGDRGLIANETEDREHWERRVSHATDAIDAADFDKVVLARSLQYTAPAGHVFDPIATAATLRERHPGCTAFMLRLQDGTAFVGATPETLVRLEGSALQTVALAGTAPRGITDALDRRLARALLESAKDQGEHRVVVEAIAATIGPLVRELHMPESPEVLGFADVQHLATPISGQLWERTPLLELALALHPTPAVAGRPREAALAYLERHEALDRGLYAAPVGWMAPSGDGVFAVALRSALLEPTRAFAFAGAGIVAQSDPGLEWEETGYKLRAVDRALTLRSEA